MKAFAPLLVISAMALAANAHRNVQNVVQDAREQQELISCYDPVDPSNVTAGWYLSEPVYQLCSIMPDPKDYNKVYANGVDDESDDYAPKLAIFNLAEKQQGFAVLNLCLQEAFQFHAPAHPSQVSMRCLCRRSGCNLPKPFTSFLDFNKHVIPRDMF